MILEIKSKLDAEFRRFGLKRQQQFDFDYFYKLLEQLHGLYNTEFNIFYIDRDGDLLPINNDCNLSHVFQVNMNILRLIIQRKGECHPLNKTSTNHHYHSKPSVNSSNMFKKPLEISLPKDFRPVSAILAADVQSDSFRRVRLHKHQSNKPLGFYIRDGFSLRVTPQGVEQIPGVFISRLMPGGLAQSTGLLSVNDEVIEVNGIEVFGKTIDQVTDMMVANCSNLIITIKPTNQRYNTNKNMLPILQNPANTLPKFDPNQERIQSANKPDKNGLDLKRSFNKDSKDVEEDEKMSLQNEAANQNDEDDDDDDDDEGDKILTL